ncbi:pyridoxal phosphate-dependent aminotransferase [Paenibacillus caui]|uniref:pyridoxal phosphate-dependent aminotransferase n=1 Tax=Paenibacillus caui TaxID=2873927 RepID=UPI001CA9848B|nr:pyridoxal phosphate-dependent aminotransferase [Paenibacillus caui]
MDIINLGGGEPDFDTPPNIVEAAEAAMKSGMTHYVNSAGIPELRSEIARKLASIDGAEYDASQIIVTPGGKIAFMTAVNPGDEVIVVNPSWVSYEPLISMVGGRAVFVHLDQNDNFKLTRNLIEGACTPRTKAVIVNTPNNPTGRVLTKEEIGELSDVASANNLIVISDEVYDKLVFGDHPFVCVASVQGLTERTITVQSFSKGYAMTGWRLGYLALPKDLFASALKAQQHIMTCTAAFVQQAGIAALKDAEEDVLKMNSKYEGRLKNVAEALNKIPGVKCPMPEGAFYVFPEIHFRDYDSYQLTDYLLNEAGVVVTPGEAFGPQYTKHIRMSCAEADDLLSDALVRIEKAFKS